MALYDDWDTYMGFWLEVNVICDHRAYTIVIVNILVTFYSTDYLEMVSQELSLKIALAIYISDS